MMVLKIIGVTLITIVLFLILLIGSPFELRYYDYSMCT